MDSPFVVPDVVRLPLSGGHWIEVKRELSYGEEQDMYARMRRQLAPGDVPVLDPTLIGSSRMEAYILNWSFEEQGKKTPISAGAFRQLKTRVAREIRDLLERHEASVLQEQDDEKKTPTGEPASSPTSLSAK